MLAAVGGVDVERRALVGGAVEIDVAARLAVDQDLGAAAARLLEERDLNAVIGEAALRLEAERRAGVMRDRVEAGEVEAARLVRFLQRFVAPAVGRVAVEQSRDGIDQIDPEAFVEVANRIASSWTRCEAPSTDLSCGQCAT